MLNGLALTRRNSSSPKTKQQRKQKREEEKREGLTRAETLFGTEPTEWEYVVCSPHFPYLTLHMGPRLVLMAWQSFMVRTRCTTPEEESDTHTRSHPNALSRVEQLCGTC